MSPARGSQVPPRPHSLAGLRKDDFRRAAARGLLVAVGLGLTWVYLADRHLKLPPSDLVGAAPLALVRDAAVRSRHGALAPLCVLVVAMLWFWGAPAQWVYLEGLVVHGMHRVALAAATSYMTSPPAGFQLLGTLALGVPFAVGAWGNARGDRLGRAIARSVVGSVAGGCAVLWVRAQTLHLMGVPAGVSQLPVALCIAVLAGALPLVDGVLEWIRTRGDPPHAEPA